VPLESQNRERLVHGCLLSGKDIHNHVGILEILLKSEPSRPNGVASCNDTGENIREQDLGVET
jgi:hypothetical protein